MTLLDGRTIDQSEVYFDPDALTWTAGNGEDLTWNLYFRDRQNFADFDVQAWNDKVYQARYAAEHGGQNPAPVGSTSTLANFWDQITTDPLDAPLDSLNDFLKYLGKKIADSPAVQKIGVAVVIGVVLIVILKNPRR